MNLTANTYLHAEHLLRVGCCERIGQTSSLPGKNATNRVRWSLVALAIMSIATAPLRAQLVRENNPQAPQGKEVKQQPSAEQTPLGKRRVSQEIQLTGEQLWSDTGIDVLPGEHIVVTASGKLSYADAKEDDDATNLDHEIRCSRNASSKGRARPRAGTWRNKSARRGERREFRRCSRAYGRLSRPAADPRRAGI